MEVNVHDAKTQLSKLIAAAESGEEVIIARAGKPVVKLTLISDPKRRSRKELRGSGAGKIWLSPEAFTPEAGAEIQQMFDDESERSSELL
jgi:prevent-host-death family protein